MNWLKVRGHLDAREFRRATSACPRRGPFAILLYACIICIYRNGLTRTLSSIRWLTFNYIPAQRASPTTQALRDATGFHGTGAILPQPLQPPAKCDAVLTRRRIATVAVEYYFNRLARAHRPTSDGVVQNITARQSDQRRSTICRDTIISDSHSFW